MLAQPFPPSPPAVSMRTRSTNLRRVERGASTALDKKRRRISTSFPNKNFLQ
jgi:hypothetical protein